MSAGSRAAEVVVVRRADRVVAALARAGLASLLLAAAEVTLAQTSRADLITGGEALRYAGAALGVAALTALLGTALLALLRGIAARGAIDPSPAGRRLAVLVFVLVAAGSDLVLWRLTSGRRAHTMPARELLVALAAGLVAVAMAFVASRWLGWRRSGAPRSRALVALALVVAAIACLAIDQRVLLRNYPAFHWALASLAVLAACAAADLASLGGARSRSLARTLASLVVVGSLAAGPALWALRLSANARYQAEQLAPLTGKAVAMLRRMTPRSLPRRATPAANAPVRVATPDDASVPLDGGESRALALVDQSVLLVTIDALRADRLAAYGGHGLTPELDALARESVVFGRAYTPTPHTSHALGSLFTGTFLRAVLTLPSGGAARPTVASLLRQAGFHTAAFYPPAVFFVDGDELGALRADGFGFEQRTVGWATAPERAHQVAQWLARRADTEPVFVWAHVFEPHEPYEPPAVFARGESQLERYDGEVAASDAGVGELVRAFRARRPSGTVIITADHGEEFGEHGGHFHGTSLYDEQARVPLLWSSPGAARARRVDTPVELVDLATTLLAALGVPPDVRMRGDDLGALLRGADDGTPGADSETPPYAFASVADEWMVTDGLCKAICAEGEADCRLYDLVADPAERDNVAESRPADVTRLRDALAAFISSIPRVEAGDDARAPLARARLGDPTAGPAVLPLLGSPDAALRAEAAAALAGLRFSPSLPSLARLRRHDPEQAVRDEASIAAFVLGEAAASAELARIATTTSSCASPDAGCLDRLALDRTRRAALALAAAGDDAGATTLLALAADESARESQRSSAISALGALRVRGARVVLEPLLAHIVLRTVAAEALGLLGDRRAGDALSRALAEERYMGARVAEALALVRLHDRRAVTTIRAQLGAAQPLLDGVSLLVQAGDLTRPSSRGADLRRSASVRRGAWRCSAAGPATGEGGCAPLEGARLALPPTAAPAPRQRIVVRAVVGDEPSAAPAAEVRPPATLAIGAATPLTLPPGTHELAFDLDANIPSGGLSVRVSGEVRIVAVALVARAAVVAPSP